MTTDIGSVTSEMTQTIDAANSSFENVWSLIADTADMIGSKSIKNFSVMRTVSYNPQNIKALEVKPSIQSGSQVLCTVISSTLNELQNDPNNASLWILAGKCYLLLSDFTNAYSSFTHVLRINQPVSDPYFWYSIGCVYQHFKFYEKALEFFNNVSDIGQGVLYQDYHLRLGLVYSYLDMPQKATKEFDMVLNSPPDGFTQDDIVFQKAFANLRGQTLEAGIKEIDQLYVKYPDNLKILQQYAWSLSFTDEAGNKLAKELIESHPQYAKDPLLMLVLARIALNSNDMEIAYDRYRKCINDWMESPVFWCGLGVLYFNNGQQGDASIAFEKAIVLRSEMAEAWLNLGLIAEEMKKPENALKIYDVGSRNCPNNKKLLERIKRLSTSGRTAQQPVEIEEIKDSKFFVQVGDLHAASVTRLPPPLPGNDIVKDAAAAKAIEELRIPYDSLFVEA